MTCLVDASHTSNKVAYRSHNGIFIFLKNVPVVWYSKKQNTVESSTFGSEFVALRLAKGLRYKLRIFGVSIDGTTSVMCDNQSVMKNATVPTSMLSKKHNSICYHKVRESVASRWINNAWIKSSLNIADLFTKVLPMVTRNGLVDRMMVRWPPKK